MNARRRPGRVDSESPIRLIAMLVTVIALLLAVTIVLPH